MRADIPFQRAFNNFISVEPRPLQYNNSLAAARRRRRDREKKNERMSLKVSLFRGVKQIKVNKGVFNFLHLIWS